MGPSDEAACATIRRTKTHLPPTGANCRIAQGTSMPAAAMATFGQLLRRHRLAAGLSQEALAERSGLSVRGLSDLERGARRAPRAETIGMLADALDLSPSERAALAAAARSGSAAANRSSENAERANAERS